VTRRLMVREVESVAQLATRIPRALRRAVKLYCTATDTTVMAFVTDAIAEKLARENPPASRRRRR
jgi:hypothetical protein